VKTWPPLIRREAVRPAADSLRERVVLIAGATGGLGRACAIECARAGATVVLAGRKVRALEGLYDELESLGAPTPGIYPIDFAGATADDYAAMADALHHQCGRLDAIVHGAIHFDGLRPVDQIKTDDWMRAQQVGLNAPFLLTQACLPVLRQRQDAAVVFVLDDPGRMGKAYWGGYGVAKAALGTFASVLHQETENTRVRVHALLPGPMRTGLRRMAYFGEDTMTIETPDAAGAAAAFLVGAEAASLRGQTLDLRRID
jgi:NAD(P)-dependent dehydrogenase (short-subunit alcohol dehydrogenase family)